MSVASDRLLVTEQQREQAMKDAMVLEKNDLIHLQTKMNLMRSRNRIVQLAKTVLPSPPLYPPDRWF